MANGSRFNVECLGNDRIPVFGSFSPAATAAPTGLKGKGVTSVTRIGVGHFRLTFRDAFYDMECATYGVREAGAAECIAQGGDWVSANKTLDVLLFKAGVAADLAADADNEVSFQVWFKNTGEP